MKFKLGRILTGAVLLITLAAVPTSLVVCSVGLVATSCSTTNSTNSPGTNPPPNPIIIGSVSLVLHGGALAGATLAINSDTNNRAYFQLAAQGLGQFLTGRDFTPAAFQAALLAVDGVTNHWVDLAIGAVVDSYQFYFASYVQNTVNGNAYAKAFIGAIQDGFNEALGNPVTHTLAWRRARVQQTKGPVLPRPIK